LNLGIVRYQQQRFGEAADILRKALALQPNSPSARLYEGMAFLALNEFDDAERELKTAHDLGGASFAVALFHLGQVYMNKGDRDQARRAFQIYLREAPTAPNAAEARKMVAILQ